MAVEAEVQPPEQIALGIIRLSKNARNHTIFTVVIPLSPERAASTSLRRSWSQSCENTLDQTLSEKFVDKYDEYDIVTRIWKLKGAGNILNYEHHVALLTSG